VKRAHAIVLFAAVAIAATTGGAAYHLWSRSGAAVAAGSGAVVEQIYAARLADLKGGTQTLGQWQGQVLVVNFWATWCAPCREEVPAFVRMQERFGPRGLQFVGIAIDQPDKVAEFSREFHINYPLLMGGLETMELMRQAGNRAGVLPYTLVIDRDGKLVSREPGGLKEARLERLIQPLL
jgi:thiol-disulfide isomerase/thioredoxin